MVDLPATCFNCSIFFPGEPETPFYMLDHFLVSFLVSSQAFYSLIGGGQERGQGWVRVCDEEAGFGVILAAVLP